MGSKTSLRKQADKTVHDSVNLLLRMMDIMPIGIAYFDSNQRFCFANKNYQLLTNLSQDDLIGETLEAVIGAEHYRNARPYVERALKGESVSYEYTLSAEGGGTITIAVSLKPNDAPDGSFSGFFALVENITEQKRDAEALRDSEARYREIYDESPVGIWEDDWSDVKRMLDDLVAGGVTDLHEYFHDNPDELKKAYDLSKVVEISRANCEMYGAPNMQALILSTRADLETDDELAGFQESMIAFMAGETVFEYEALNSRLDGTPMVTSNRLVLPPKHNHDWSRVVYAIEDITERKRAEEALRGSEKRFRELLESAPDAMVIVNQQGEILLVNKQTEAVFGYPRDELVGRTVEMLVPDDRRERHTRYREVFSANPRLRPMGQTAELHGVARCGRELPVEISLSPIQMDEGELVVVTVRDITERKQAEAELSASETRFRDFTNASSDWFWEMDEELRFSYFSDRFTEVTGVSQEMLLGKTRQQTGVPGVDPGEWEKKHLANLAARRPFRDFRHSRTRHDGRVVHLSINGKPIFEEDGKFKGYRGTGSDITERMEANEALIAAKEQAEFASRSKSDFLANISHELRTPLNDIIGFSDLMKVEIFGPVGSPKYLEYARDINASGVHLLELINGILDLSKIEAGKAELHAENVDVMRVLRICLILIKERARIGGVEIEYDAAPDLPALHSDERKLKQIMHNLL